MDLKTLKEDCPTWQWSAEKFRFGYRYIGLHPVHGSAVVYPIIFETHLCGYEGTVEWLVKLENHDPVLYEDWFHKTFYTKNKLDTPKVSYWLGKTLKGPGYYVWYQSGKDGCGGVSAIHAKKFSNKKDVPVWCKPVPVYVVE